MEARTCPFCGQPPMIKEVYTGMQFETYYFIKCSNPKCEAAIKNPFKTREEAVEYWNTRVEPEGCKLEQSKDTPFAESKPQLNTEAITKLYDHVSEKYGDKSIWLVLFLMCQIDIEAWKFPNYLRAAPFRVLLDEIEQDKEIRDAFQKVGDAR